MFLLKVIFIIVNIIGLISSKYVDSSDENTNNRIVNGTDAEDGSAPYQVSLQIFGTSHNCGGAIIHPRLILTAGHCVSGYKPDEYKILVGTNKLSEGKIYYEAEKLIVHSQFNNPMYHNDIGLVLLKSEIEFTEKVQPIEYDWRDVPIGETIRLTGWGRLSAGGLIPDNLQEINLTRISYEECKIKQVAIGVDTDYGHLCTFTKQGEGACNGDSGGPLAYKDRLVAIVNYGQPCARGYPDGHARVAYYHDWIRTNINKYT